MTGSAQPVDLTAEDEDILPAQRLEIVEAALSQVDVAVASAVCHFVLQEQNGLYKQACTL